MTPPDPEITVPQTLEAPAPADAATDYQPGFGFFGRELRIPACKAKGRARAHRVSTQVEMQTDGRLLARTVVVRGNYWHGGETLYLGWDLMDALRATERFNAEAMKAGAVDKTPSEYDMSEPMPDFWHLYFRQQEHNLWHDQDKMHRLSHIKDRAIGHMTAMRKDALGEDWHAERALRIACREARIQAGREHFIHRCVTSGVVR